MLSAYVGLPGHGKSYTSVMDVIVPALKDDRKIITNVPVIIDGLKDHLKKNELKVQLVETDDLKDENFLESLDGGSVIVIDECSDLWPSGLKTANIPVKTREFFSKHRHKTLDGISQEIVLIVQDLSMVCSFVRSLVERTYQVNKLIEVGQSDRFRIDIYRSGVTGTRPPDRFFQHSKHNKFDKELASKLYISNTLGDGNGEDKSVDKSFSIFNRKFYFYCACWVLACFVVFFVGYNFITGLTSDNTDEIETVELVESQVLDVPENATGINSVNSNPVTNNQVSVRKNFLDFVDGGFIYFSAGKYPNFNFKFKFYLSDGGVIVLTPSELYKQKIITNVISGCAVELFHEETMNNLFIGCDSEGVEPSKNLLSVN